MKKKFLLLFAVIVVAINASAYDFEIDGIYYNYLSQEDLTCEVTYGDNKYSGDIVIPSTVTYNEQTYSVTTIGEIAFRFCSSLTSVVIPNSVTTIGYNSFMGCSKLVSIYVPDSVTSIGYGAFADCSDLTSFTGKFATEDHRCLIVDGVLKAFAPAGLTTYNIPNSVTSIGEMALSYCTNLTSVEIPNSVISIGEMAFYNCNSLTSIDIPNSVTLIGTKAFCLCHALTSLVIGNSVTKIGYNAFTQCYNLKEITSLAVTPPTVATNSFYPDAFREVSREECVLKVPEESLEAYKAADLWKEFINIEGITTGISTPSANSSHTGGKAYKLNGTEVNEGYRGIVIKNGKKILRN